MMSDRFFFRLGTLMSADTLRRIAVCVISKEMDNQCCRNGFPPPLDPPLSFGYARFALKKDSLCKAIIERYRSTLAVSAMRAV